MKKISDSDKVISSSIIPDSVMFCGPRNNSKCHKIFFGKWME